MSELQHDLQERLSHLHELGLHRQLRRVDSSKGSQLTVDGKPLLNFSSNDYLGLTSDPRLRDASIECIRNYGSGSGAARLLSGSLAPHHTLEEHLAEFNQTEAALSFSSGYAATLGTVTALLTKDDIIIIDKLVHASVVDAARLSGAKLRVFDHNDLNQLEDILKWTRKPRTGGDAKEGRRVLIATESAFSMDGDLAPLREIVRLKHEHGAWLLVDEAHATGIFGPNRRGLIEQTQTTDGVDIQMGTLGKALGSSGGYICGSRKLIDFLINSARTFIFSTAPIPAASAAATAAIRIVGSAEGETLRTRLWSNIHTFQDKAASAIVPIHVGDESRAVEAAGALRDRGYFIPAIRYPTVARGSARLRVSINASHSTNEARDLRTAINSILCA